MVMYAMNSLYFDHYKHRLFKPLSGPADPTAFAELDQTLLNLAAIKPAVMEAPSAAGSGTSGASPTGSASSISPTLNPRYRRIALIESWQDRERRRRTEPIYGIDHRRQFVKNRQALPPSSHVPANWRPFKTIRYEREINSNKATMSASAGSNVSNSLPSSSTSTASSASAPTIPQSLAKLYYCVNVFYAPPPTFPPIQLFLQVGTTPDTSTSGFLHRLQFTNLIETENYLQNLRNLLLIENGNCNLKVITDISTTTANPAAGAAPGLVRKPMALGVQVNNNNNNNNTGNSANPTSSNPTSASTSSSPQIQHPQSQQYQLTPHQILQLNQQRNPSKERLPSQQQQFNKF